ncbi:MAG: aminotransferase class I/II-fold pyridoxal phosphate-dependent enzyme [Ornithinimicrobium sp.]
MTRRSGADALGRSRRQGTDRTALQRHFGLSEGLLPLWIAEPSIDVAPELIAEMQARASAGWYGYEVRPESIIESFWEWSSRRVGWDGRGLRTLISPSVGTSVGVLLEELTSPGDGVILQPPVFTDFKTLVTASGRQPVRNSLELTDSGYHIDFERLATQAADPRTRVLILCSPHNPVGRVWTVEELRQVAVMCAENDVFVLADEIHADIVLAPHTFTPFAHAAAGIDLAWAAMHGPLKTFGLAGVCDTLVVTDQNAIADRFAARSSQLHLTRNNVFGLAAFEAAYRLGDGWLDDFLALVAHNVDLLRTRLPDPITVLPLEGTYLAWLDLRGLELDVPEVPTWLASSAGLAVSPGHWFGREGAGFARMTIAAPSEVMEQAAAQLTAAVHERSDTSRNPHD